MAETRAELYPPQEPGVVPHPPPAQSEPPTSSEDQDASSSTRKELDSFWKPIDAINQAVRGRTEPAPKQRRILSDDEITGIVDIEKGFQKFDSATGEGGMVEPSAAPPGSEPMSEEERQGFLKRLDDEGKLDDETREMLGLFSNAEERQLKQAATSHPTQDDKPKSVIQAHRDEVDRAVKVMGEATELLRRKTPKPPSDEPPLVTDRPKARKLKPAETVGLVVGIAIPIVGFILSAPSAAGVTGVLEARELLGVAWLLTVLGALVIEWLSGRTRRRIALTVLFSAIIMAACLLFIDHRISNKKEQQDIKAQARATTKHPPSFVFVKPGLWLNNSIWYFVLEHKGSEPVYNIEILFTEIDRSKDTMIDSPEIDPGNFGVPKHFLWQPLVPDHEHFSALISYRNGHAQQDLRIEKVGQEWQYATRVIDSDTKKVLLECRDPRFPVDKEWTEALPKCFPDFSTKD